MVTTSNTVYSLVSELVTVLAASCHNLAHLEVKFCLPLSVTDLRSLSSGCPKLRTLNLEGTGEREAKSYSSGIFIVIQDELDISNER